MDSWLLKRGDFYMICLDIIVENKYDKYLSKIFNGIDLNNYNWQIEFDDIFYTTNGKVQDRFFPESNLNGEEFGKYISRENYYLVFAEIKAFPKGSECTKINTFKEFLDSNCEIAFLCIDSIYIEFYCKNNIIIEIVHNNCMRYGIKEAKYRTISDVLERNINV
jgi:hypothetical protein